MDTVHSPIPIATAASWDLDLIESCERVAAEESYLRVSTGCAPMVDLCANRVGDELPKVRRRPVLGASIAAASRARLPNDQSQKRDIRTLQPASALLRLWPCRRRRDYDTTDISERTLFGEYLKTYQGAIDAGAMSTMSSFNCLNGEPVSDPITI